MENKYSCPKCGKKLSEADTIRGICSHCHKLFDVLKTKRVPSQKEQEKEQSEKKKEKHGELPAKAINKVRIIVLSFLFVIFLISYFTIPKIITEKKASQKEVRVRAKGAEEAQQKREKMLEESRLATERENEERVQRCYHKGETAFQGGKYIEALKSYTEALTYKPKDSRIQRKISLTITKIEEGIKAKQSQIQEIKDIEEKIGEVKKYAKEAIRKSKEALELAKKKERVLKSSTTSAPPSITKITRYSPVRVDPSPIIKRINSIVVLGTPGPILILKPDVVPVVAGDDDTTPVLSVVAVATEFGKGRVVALGHSGFLSNKTLKLYDNKQFVNNITDWLAKNSGKRKVLITTGHREHGLLKDLKTELESRRYTVTEFAGKINGARLSGVGVVLVCTAWGSVSPSEIDALTEFVSRGGGLFLTGLGWSWESYNPKFTLDEFPMNKIGERFGIRWIGGYIDDLTHKHEKRGVIFHTFYPNIEIQTIY